MKIEVTPKVANHLSNNNYYCVIVQFEDDDKHFFADKKNWLPKDMEVYALCKVLYGISPSFRALIDKEFGGVKNGKVENRNAESKDCLGVGNTR